MTIEEATRPLTDEEIDQLTDAERYERASIAVAELLRKQAENPLPIEQRRSGRTSPEWLQMASGIFAGSETFEEAVKHGEAWRNAEYVENGWE